MNLSLVSWFILVVLITEFEFEAGWDLVVAQLLFIRNNAYWSCHPGNMSSIVSVSNLNIQASIKIVIDGVSNCRSVLMPSIDDFLLNQVKRES